MSFFGGILKGIGSAGSKMWDSFKASESFAAHTLLPIVSLGLVHAPSGDSTAPVLSSNPTNNFQLIGGQTVSSLLNTTSSTSGTSILNNGSGLGSILGGIVNTANDVFSQIKLPTLNVDATPTVENSINKYLPFILIGAALLLFTGRSKGRGRY